MIIKRCEMGNMNDAIRGKYAAINARHSSAPEDTRPKVVPGRYSTGVKNGGGSYRDRSVNDRIWNAAHRNAIAPGESHGV